MFAQNNKISYQAVVRDSENRLVANKTVEVTVNIFNGDATTAAYSETQTTTSNLNGLISLLVGNGTVNSGNWGLIDWKIARIETAVALNGTSLGTLEMPFTAVPYAMYAEYADEIDPEAAVVIGIYNKILYDSLILAGQINNLKAADNALSTRISNDSANLKNNYYTKNETNIMLGAKADTSKVYTRTIIDNKLDTKANANEVYSKNEMDQQLGVKADTSSVYTRDKVYTKAEVDALLADINALINAMPTMGQESFTATAGQTNFTLANAPKSNYIYRMYINGVMVGGSNTEVLTISSTAVKTMHYDATKNGDKTLQAGDKVTIVYWYIPETSTTTVGD